ncbi:MAG: chromophore lyase CpcT/CpeT [Microcystaceae cyanobacterium]
MFLRKYLYSSLVFLAFGSFSLKAEALTTNSTFLEQTQEAARWFSGRFSNEAQFKQDSSVNSLILMSNCPVSIVGGSFGANTQSIFLEQIFVENPFPQSPRRRYYAFSPTTTGVLLSVYGFDDETGLEGLCNQSTTPKTLDFSNILTDSCDVELTQALDPRRYEGSNTPNGCPAISNPSLTVISTLTIQSKEIFSLDEGFITGNPNPIFGTEIIFQSVPEPSLLAGISVVGLMFLRRKT